jgi:hypothetical protein
VSSTCQPAGEARPLTSARNSRCDFATLPPI